MENILKITGVVCDYYHMDAEDIMRKDNRKSVSIVRNMAYYVLHCKMGYSISQIAKTFGKCERGIKQRIANTKYIVETQKVYKDEFKAIGNNIKEKLK